MIRVEECRDQAAWDEYLLDHGGHPLQLWGWGELEAKHSWQVERVFVVEDDQIIGAAQLQVRPLPRPFNSLVYIARGPLAHSDKRRLVMNRLAAYAKQNHRAVALTVEPDWTEAVDLPNWRHSRNKVLLAETLILDLNQELADLLASMSKKTRQYIRKSERSGLDVRPVKSPEELTACLEVYKQTAERAGFGIHDDAYYHDLAQEMGQHSLVLAAYEDEKVVAFLWLALSQSTAFELYGGVNDRGQQLRANYILKWQAITKAREWGIERYDMNGLLNDGVSNFKRSFASHENQLVGTLDRPLSLAYFAWSSLLPLGKVVIRRLATLRKRQR